MTNRLLPALSILVVILVFITCVQEIDFSKENTGQNTLVVSGTFTDGPGPHILRLTRPGNIDKQAFKPVPGALVSLSDDQGNRYDYQEILSLSDTTLFYQLDNVQGIAGREYQIEIRLPDGETYRSRPEKMPQRVLIDSVAVRAEYFTSINANGTIVKEPFAYLYAHTTSPAQTTGNYLRWDAEAVYIFNEVLKIYHPIPPPQKQCFIPSRLSDQLVPLADLNIYQPGAAIITQVGKRRIDRSFEHRIGFLVHQRAISREAYEYWQKIGQLISPTGTIFDVPPARVYGNVENETDPDRPALGYFEVSAVDTARVFTRNGLLGDDFLLQVNPYCNYDWSKWPPVNHPECDNCLLLEGSTLQKPEWWE